MSFNYDMFLRKTPERQIDIIDWIVGLSEEFQIPKETFLLKLIGNQKFPNNLVEKIFKDQLWGVTPDFLGKITTLSGQRVSIPVYCYSAIRDDFERTRTIIKSGADLNKKFKYHYASGDITPLEYLISQAAGLHDILHKYVTLFIAYGADADQSSKFLESQGTLLTFLAIIITDEYNISGDTETVKNMIHVLKLLIISGANPSKTNKKHLTCFEILPIGIRRLYNLRKMVEINYNKSEKCVICRDNTPEVSIFPCGHICLCLKCVFDVTDDTNLCPLCRGYISQYQIIRNYDQSVISNEKLKIKDKSENQIENELNIFEPDLIVENDIYDSD